MDRVVVDAGCALSVQCSDSVGVKARKQHWCYLCTLPIERGTVYARWACFGDGTAITIRTHPACKNYAERHIDEWGDEGVDWYAAEADIRERLQAWKPAGVLVGLDAAEAAKIVADFPALARLVELVSREIRADSTEDAEPVPNAGTA